MVEASSMSILPDVSLSDTNFIDVMSLFSTGIVSLVHRRWSTSGGRRQQTLLRASIGGAQIAPPTILVYVHREGGTTGQLASSNSVRWPRRTTAILYIKVL